MVVLRSAGPLIACERSDYSYCCQVCCNNRQYEPPPASSYCCNNTKDATDCREERKQEHAFAVLINPYSFAYDFADRPKRCEY